MKGAVITGNGLEVREVPQPTPKPHEVLVRVHASGLNRADLQMASGHRHGAMGGAGAVAGMEFSGEVVEAGSEAKGFKPGDRVMGGGAGAFAEYVVADFGRTIPIPAGMSFEQAATLPVALVTMHNAIITLGRFKAGEAVLIQGASSGVGIMGLQIAKLKGARIVVGTSTNEVRRAGLKQFGADLAVNSRDPKWVDQVLEATGGGVDLIVDMISGYVANQNMQAAKVLGRIVNIGRLGGFKGEFDFDYHALKRIDYIGATFRTRSIEEVREINRLMRADILDAAAAGTLRIPVDRTFPLADIRNAIDHANANAHFGKVVIVA
jgi:NADPH2:quinone reductase